MWKLRLLALDNSFKVTKIVTGIASSGISDSISGPKHLRKSQIVLELSRSSALLPTFFGDYRNKGALILTSLLEDLIKLRGRSSRAF